MKLENLQKQKGKIKAAKRVGRGESSGKGKTSGKGYKGQKARGRIPAEFEGGQLPIIKRLPFQKGIGNTQLYNKTTITLSDINKLKANEEVTITNLLKNKIIKNLPNLKVKIVASGKIDKPLTVKIPVSAQARKAIESAKGKVE